MKYLARNTNTNVVELVFDLPVNASPPLELIQVPNQQFRSDMINSIFFNVNSYKPTPAWGKEENWWISNGTNWVDIRDENKVWGIVRARRNTELLESDWTQIDDSPLTPSEKAQWTAYRVLLRNIPQNNPNARNAEQALDNAVRNNKPATGRSA